MPKYAVVIHQTNTRKGSVDVDAETREQAEEFAQKLRYRVRNWRESGWDTDYCEATT